MDTETVKKLAGDIAENIIDKYLDVTDLAEDIAEDADVAEFTAENTSAFAGEVARLIEEWVHTAIVDAQNADY
jgi:hypothetical protein